MQRDFGHIFKAWDMWSKGKITDFITYFVLSYKYSCEIVINQIYTVLKTPQRHPNVPLGKLIRLFVDINDSSILSADAQTVCLSWSVAHVGNSSKPRSVLT